MQISMHRLSDGYYDCFTNDGDEYYHSESCYNTVKDRYQCSADIHVQCIPRRGLRDGHEDCFDVDDEQFGIGCTEEYDCAYFRQFNFDSPFPIVFDELCNGREVLDPTWRDMHGPEHTDETDCDGWPCNAGPVRCNGKWDRKSGCDEVGCSNPFA
ncbi:unnamed protein product, partial [Rotaria sp. Silwood2]